MAMQNEAAAPHLKPRLGWWKLTPMELMKRDAGLEEAPDQPPLLLFLE
jgi:hypothetical protein